MAQTVKDFEKVVTDNTKAIKQIDQELRRLNKLKTAYSTGSLTTEEEKALREVNKQIETINSDKVELKIELDTAKRVLPSLKSIENIDKQLEREYAAYQRASRTGEKPNKSRINQLLSQREGLVRIVGGYAPEVPKAPKEFTAEEAVTPTAKPKTQLQADVTAEEQAKTEAQAGKGKTATGEIDYTKTTAEGDLATKRYQAMQQFYTGTTATGPTGTKKDLKTLLAQTEFWYDLPDYVFNLDPKLGELLVKAVAEGWDNDKFLAAAKLTPWWQKNATPIRQRIVSKAKFDELRAAGQDVTNTEYALDTNTIRRNVQTRARQMGATLDPNALEQIVSKVYSGFLENDELAIDAFIAPYIGKITSIAGTGVGGTAINAFSGQALQNYQTLQAIAKANGLALRDLLPGISTATTGGDLETAVLQKLATGEIDINRIAQDARTIAGLGQPEYVRNLLGQGYDLEQIYAPYKGVMASVLEINPEEIDLKELSGYGLFADKGQMNIYDFKRALRKDARWQYTEQAKGEVADSVLGVLRDFGFQG